MGIPKKSAGLPLGRLVPKIHPPLDRTPRETQQLLNVINSSFRQQLDKQYPPVAAGSPYHDDGKTPPQPRRTTTVNKHLNSVLGHPHFNTPSRPRYVEPDPKQGLDNLVAQRKEPVMILREAMACGRADITTLLRCLAAQQTIMQGKSDSETRQAMEASGFRHTLLSWVRAATPSMRREMLSHGGIMGMALPYFCSAGMQEDVIGWLELFLKQDGGKVAMAPEGNPHVTQFHFIHRFITAELEYGSGIVSALEIYMRICSMTSQHPSPESTDFDIIQRASRGTACYLTHWISKHPDKSSSIPEALFHQLSAVQREVRTPRVYRVLLPLFHPTDPDTQPAMDLTIFSDRHPSTYHGKESIVLQRICSRSAELCLEREQYKNVRLLLKYAQELLPDKPQPSRILSSNDDAELISPNELVNRLDTLTV